MLCQKRVVPGYNKCEHHGGPVPKRNFYGRGYMTNGKASSFQLTRLAAKYNQMMKDGRVLSNRQAIDVVDQRIVQLLERVDRDDAPDRMKRLIELWKEYDSDLENGRSAEAARLRKEISDEFEKAYHDYAAWEQIFTALDLRRKQVESEVKVLTQIKAVITAEDAYDLTAKLLAAVMRVVNDEPKKMKQVQYEFSKLIGESGEFPPNKFVEYDAGSDGESGGEEGFGDVDSEELPYPGDAERPET